MTKTVRKGKCALGTQGLGSETVVFDCDRCQCHQHQGNKLCDYVVVQNGQRLFLSVLELKDGWFDARDVAEQLQAGADRLEEHVSEQPVGLLIPILVHAKGIDPNEFRQLQKQKVLHRGKKYPIRTCKPGASLKAIITVR